MSEQNNREERDSQGRPKANDRKPPQRKSYSDRQSSAGRPVRDGERKPFSKEGGPRKPFNGDRPGRDGERRSFGSDRGERKPFGDRPGRDGERKPFNKEGGPRKPFNGDRGERKPYGDRPARDDRKPFSNDRGDRKPFGDRPSRDGERKPFRKDSERRPSSDRPFRKDDRPQRRTGDDAPVTERKHNARDLRSANRADRERSPEIDDDVTGQELDKVTRAQLRNLEEVNGEWVSKHLVMAGRLIDADPELAFQHALAASRRGGRMAAVREAVALTAYAAGEFGDALREFRTHRRISGSNEYLAMMADCERGLGRPDRALDLLRSEDVAELDNSVKVDVAIVASGARMDMEQFDAAVSALEIPQLDKNRAFSYSPRLFRAYADALELAGRGKEAETWRRQAVVAESALGVGDFAEPEIMDLGEDDEAPAKPRFRRDNDGNEANAGQARGEDRSANYAQAPEAASADLDLDDESGDDALPSDEREALLGAEETEPDSEDNETAEADAAEEAAAERND